MRRRILVAGAGGQLAFEAAARTMCRSLGVPTTVARMNLSYGPDGGLPAYQLDAIRRGAPVPVAAHHTFDNPIHTDDVVASIPGLLAVASVPATVINCAGPDTVSMREYCTLLAELEGRPITFEPVDGFIRSPAVDTTRQHELLGPCPTDWRTGMERLVATRPHPTEESP